MKYDKSHFPINLSYTIIFILIDYQLTCIQCIHSLIHNILWLFQRLIEMVSMILVKVFPSYTYILYMFIYNYMYIHRAA